MVFTLKQFHQAAHRSKVTLSAIAKHKFNSFRSHLHIHHHYLTINPLQPSVIMWLHFECSAPYRSNLPFSISDIRALWRSALSARVPECQKLKMIG